MIRKHILQLGFIVVIAAGAGVFYMNSRAGDGTATCRRSAVASGTAAIGGPFQLVNHLGQTVSDKDVISEPSLVYFGYTFCPDVCPLDVARNAAAVDVLQSKGVAVTPVFITIDPDRDTPEVLADYVSVMHPKMVGLTGTPTQIKAVSDSYKTYFKKNGDGDDYLMDHSSFTYLMWPGTGFVEFYRRDLSADDLAQSVLCYAEAS